MRLQLLIFVLFANLVISRKHYKGRKYDLTLFVRNHNVSDATFFRLVGVDNTADFNVSAGNTFEHTFEVSHENWIGNGILEFHFIQ